MVEHRRAGVTLEAGVPQKNPTELVYFSRTSVREEVHTQQNIFIFTPLARALIISLTSFVLSLAPSSTSTSSSGGPTSPTSRGSRSPTSARRPSKPTCVCVVISVAQPLKSTFRVAATVVLAPSSASLLC